MRVVIIDFNHIAHAYYHSDFRLSTPVSVNGQIIQKDTTIQNGALKRVYEWSVGGVNPTAVCFDRPVPSRKAYFQSVFPQMAIGTGNEYKGNREFMAEGMYQGISDCENILRQAGVSVFARYNYEADDLIYACVKYAKKAYQGIPIDVITNDADLLPLVDNQVSVFLRSRKGTWAESDSIMKKHYIQVTPNNYEKLVEDLSAYKKYYMPYNTVLLYKILRGDSSDNYMKYLDKDIKAQFSPKKWNEFMHHIVDEEHIDVSNLFRYSDPNYHVAYRDTGLRYEGTIEDAKRSSNRANLALKVDDSDELIRIKELLKKYSKLTDKQIDIVAGVYKGMNLNQPYPNVNSRLSRHAYVVGKTESTIIHGYSEIELQKACEPLQIHIVKV